MKTMASGWRLNYLFSLTIGGSASARSFNRLGYCIHCARPGCFAVHAGGSSDAARAGRPLLTVEYIQKRKY